MKEIVKKHPLAIRWFHWINFPVLGIMIWSGLLIYWANDVYKIGFGSTTLLKFFPTSFYKALNIPYRLSEGMAYHFMFMWLFARAAARCCRRFSNRRPPPRPTRGRRGFASSLRAAAFRAASRRC